MIAILEHIELKVMGILCVCEREYRILETQGPERAVRVLLHLAILLPFAFSSQGFLRELRLALNLFPYVYHTPG